MTGQVDEVGPLTKEFRSAQALSWMLGAGATVLWVVLAYMVGGDTGDDGAARIFTPGPGTVVVLGLAMTATAFSAAAYAVAWVTVVVRRGTLSLQYALRDDAKD